MLQSIRERSQGWLAWTIIILISTTFVLWGADTYFHSRQPKQIAALVNGKEITRDSLESVYNQFILRQQQYLGEQFVITPDIQESLKKLALDELIKQHLLLQAAEKAGFTTSDAQIQATLIGLFQQEEAVEPENLQAVLTQLLRIDPQFITKLRGDLLVNQLQIGLTASEFTLPNDIKRAIRSIAQKRDVAYAILSSKRFKDNLTISQEAIQEYYEKHQALFRLPQQVKLQYIVLDNEELLARQRPSEEEAKEYYQANLAHYMRPKQWQVAELLVAVSPSASEEEVAAAEKKAKDLAKQAQANPDEFSKLVQTFSDDRLAAKQGGVLNWFSMDEVDPAIASVLEDLVVPNQVTDPIRTEKGFVILQHIGTRLEQLIPFSQVASSIKQQLARQQAEQAFVRMSERALQLAFERPDSLQPIADELDLTIQETGWVANYFDLPDTIAHSKVLAAAFSNEVLEQRNNSDVIELSPEKWVILRAAQQKPAKQQTLEEVEATIRERLQKKAKQEQLQELGEQIRQAWQAGTSLAKLAETHQITWRQANDLTRYNEELPNELIRLIFTIPLHRMQGNLIGEDEYGLVYIEAIHYPNLDDIPQEEWKVYQAEIANSYGQLSYASYLQALEQNAKIELVEQPAVEH